MSVRWRWLVGLALVALTSSVHAQGPAAVATDDPAYGQVARLARAGLVDTVLLGQRPYSRREFARLVRVAQRKATTAGTEHLPAAVRDALAALRERFTGDSTNSRSARARSFSFERLDLVMTSTNATPRLVPSDTGIGGVDAVIAPLTERGAWGRDVIRGTTVAAEALASWSDGATWAIEARPRLRHSTEPSYTDESALSLQTLVARYQRNNLVFSVGRDQLDWGFAREGGLFLSSNAPPLDMLRIATDQPLRLPGVLRALGPSRLTLFIADLGARQFFPHTLLVGYKGSVAPTPSVEIGLSVFNFSGGRGAPTASVLKHVTNVFLFPVIPLKGFQFSNVMAGLEVSYRPQGTSGAQWYWELNLDDFDVRRLKSVVWTDDAANVFGVVLPRVDADGRWSVGGEFHHTGTRFGRHQQFLSGAAVDRRLLGEPLGPDADGGYAFVDWQATRAAAVTLSLANEAYRANQHAIVSENPFVIAQFAARPQERRLRAALELRHDPPVVGMSWQAGVAVERVTNFDFQVRPERTSARADVRFSYSWAPAAHH
jgi:hypothetical protein